MTGEERERGSCLAEVEGIGGVPLWCSLPAGHEGRHRTRDGAEFQVYAVARGYGTDEGDDVEALVEATLNEDGTMHFDAVVVESDGAGMSDEFIASVRRFIGIDHGRFTDEGT